MEAKINENDCAKKKSFNSKEEALSRIYEIRDEENKKEKEERGKIPIRAYRCVACRKWHLTSVAKEKWKKVKKARRKADPEKNRFYKEVQYWMEKLGIDRD